MRCLLFAAFLAAVCTALPVQPNANVHVLEATPAAVPKTHDVLKAASAPLGVASEITPGTKVSAPGKAGEPHVYATGSPGILEAAEKVLGEKLNRPVHGEFAKEMSEQAQKEAKIVAGIRHQSLQMVSLSEDLGESPGMQKESLLNGMPMPAIMSAQEIAQKLEKDLPGSV